ncbi:MAG TPA: 2-amino-4-hydroxy-6-hydroxymethyldihydropteridine diphosphokinase [Nevskiaceae bacterium]|nr:2-amino-4-hydroxy-6-hydroxymethyldihydropteridine diphosphokinase [Nevskiaceae bacterium]
MRAYIGLGSNLGDPVVQVLHALGAIGRIPGCSLVAASRLYRSAPMGPPGQPDYCNAVAAVDTTLAPRALLDALLAIERGAGRVRGGDRWGPRILDLDLLHVEGVALDEPGLHLPHPGLAQRNFVIVPLADIAPALDIPGVGLAADLARAAGQEGLAPWSGA